MKKINFALPSIAMLAAFGLAFTTQAFKKTSAYQSVAAERGTDTGALSCINVGRCNIGSPNSTCYAIPAIGTKPSSIVLYTITTAPSCSVIATGTFTVTP